jgi:ligand-binding sensor domain-containing protein
MKNIFYTIVISIMLFSCLLRAQWAQTGLDSGSVFALAVSGTNLFAGTVDKGVFLSTNNGTSWTAVNSGLTIPYVLSLAVSGTNLFAGIGRASISGEVLGGVFLSTNNGSSWTEADSGLMKPYEVLCLAVSCTNLFAGTEGGDGVFLSTNNGTSWSAVNSGLTRISVVSFAVSGTNLFAGTDGGVFLSTNNGTSWSTVDSGLTNTNVLSLAVNGTNLFVGTWGNGVWVRPLSEMVTAVENNHNNIPNHFELKQNYPNPFNPSTTLSFVIGHSSFVDLKVYDVLGREVATLVNEEKPAGNYQVKFNAANLPSGIYIYKLQAGSLTETKKMILLK